MQAGVINLLDKLRAELGLSYLMVAHDLSVVRHISNRVAVMYLGKIVEIGEVDQVFDNPRHPYTRALLSAIPVPDPQLERTRERIILKGDLPSPLDAPKGCNFATRCPVFAALPAAKQEKCLTLEPPLEAVTASVGGAGVGAASAWRPDQQFACFFPDGEIDADMLVVHDGDHHDSIDLPYPIAQSRRKNEGKTMKNLTRIGGAAAVAAALALTACGGGGATRAPERPRARKPAATSPSSSASTPRTPTTWSRAARSPFRWATSARTSTGSPTTATAGTTPHCMVPSIRSP